MILANIKYWLKGDYMPSIAIEGLDGSGKSALAKYLAKTLNYEYKSDYLNDLLEISDEHFLKIREKMKNYDDVRTLLFMSSLVYATKDTNPNVIYDRFILSEYYFDGNNDTISWFDNYCKYEKLPDLTIILYASDNERIRRIRKRDINDNDLKKNICGDELYKKMIYFANYARLNYVIINTDNLTMNEVIDKAMEYVNDFINKKDKVLIK